MVRCMKITDETKRKLSAESYNDHNVNSVITTPASKFKVLEKREDTRNGLKAYAYAPIVNGKPDTNNIVMGYAGTGPLSMKIVCYFTSKE